MFHGRDRGRIETDQTQATQHPIRRMIVQLYTRDTWRPLEADVLSADLLASFPDLVAKEARPAQIAYHVAVLKDARLLPTG